MTTVATRTSDHEIDPIFLERWSPRAFTGEAIPEPELMRIFEAARWAPSSYNSQPWRFVYARRDTPHWENMLSLLNDMNRSWCKDAAVVMVVASNETMQPPGQDKPVPSYSHSFDAGAAWGYLALQATKLGWHAHGMVGFDKERAFAELGFPRRLPGRGGHRDRAEGRQVEAARAAAGPRVAECPPAAHRDGVRGQVYCLVRDRPDWNRSGRFRSHQPNPTRSASKNGASGPAWVNTQTASTRRRRASAAAKCRPAAALHIEWRSTGRRQVSVMWNRQPPNTLG